MATLIRADEVVYGNDGTWQSDDPHFIGIRGTAVDLCKYTEGRSKLIHTENID